MKKLFVIIVISIVCMWSIVAVGYNSEPSKIESVQRLIDDGLKTNREIITLQCSDLTDLDKALLYNEEKLKSPIMASALNLIGFGIGSYIQGDTGSGIGLSIIEGSGIVMLTSGILKLRADQNSVSGVFLAIFGGIFFVTARIAGPIIPFYATSQYNQKLERAIYGNTLDIALVPGISNESEKMNVTLLARVTF